MRLAKFPIDKVAVARRAAGAAAGALAAAALLALGQGLTAAAPMWLRVAISAVVFVGGPGLAAMRAIAPRADAIERAVLPFAAGVIVSPAVAQLLGEFGRLDLFPWVVTMLTGAALGWPAARPRPPARVPARDWVALALVIALATAGGVIAYGHRFTVSEGGVLLKGDYDTFDSTFYAAIAAELANQIPPDTLYHAGRPLAYAYHSQLLLAMLHRAGNVPLLDLFLRYGWPLFVIIAAVTAFVAVRRLASTGAAVLTVALLLFGSDFSFIVAWLRPPHATWDRIIWSNNWLATGAEQLYFNTWTPALAIIFLGLWFIDRHERGDGWVTLAGAAACFASLVQFKPLGFAPLMAGLLAAAVTARDWPMRRRFMLTLAGSALLALPYLYGISRVYGESQAVLSPGNGYVSVLPQKVIPQLGLDRPLAHMAQNEAVRRGLAVLLAILLFFVGGLGMRILALPAVWRDLRARQTAAAHRLVAWTIVAGALIPVVFVTTPYHQTFHPFHLSLYLLWIVTAAAVFDAGGGPRRRAIAIATVLLLSVPSTVHYLRMKWTDLDFGFVSRDAFTIAEALRASDRASTVVLQRYPQGPAIVSILSERRSVLAWSQYARGTEPLQEAIDGFFDSADRGAAAACELLAAAHVTHVVETRGRDHIHPQVLEQLEAAVTTPTLTLYRVPAPPLVGCGDDGAVRRAAR